MYNIYNSDNRNMDIAWDREYDLIYCDMMYMDKDFTFTNIWWKVLKDSGIFIVQLDYHQVAEMKLHLDTLGTFVNWCIYVNEWGGTSRKGFSRKHDDILIYSKGDNWKWDKSGIEIPKVTAGTAFDKKGTGMKTPCDVFYDHASFSTMSSERVKKEDGHLIEYQKPLWLMDRLVRPFTDEGDLVGDPFGGSFSLGEWCIKNNRNYVGIELDKTKFEIGKKRLENL